MRVWGTYCHRKKTAPAHASNCWNRSTVGIPLEDGSVHRIRKPIRPEACRWNIYRKIGITAMTFRPKTHSVLTPKQRKNTAKV